MTLPPVTIPEAPDNWREIVAQGDEHARISQQQYARYVRGVKDRKAAQIAADSLALDLSPERRALAEQKAADLSRATADAEHGLAAHQDHLRLRQQLIEDHPAAFMVRAAAIGERVQQAAAALIEPLSTYLSLVAECQAAWMEIERGTAEFVRERDRQAGYERGADAIQRDTAVTECPLPANVVELVLNTPILPRVFTKN